MNILTRLNAQVVERLPRYLASRHQVDRRALESKGTQVAQQVLFFAWRDALAGGRPLPPPSEAAFRAWSQSDEDGILLPVFAAIGFTNRVCVNLSSAGSEGSNTANLIFNWGFGGLLIDSDPVHAAAARSLFQEHPETSVSVPCSPGFRHADGYDHFGALMAWVKMLCERGYRLVATNPFRHSAFSKCLRHLANQTELAPCLARTRDRAWETV